MTKGRSDLACELSFTDPDSEIRSIYKTLIKKKSDPSKIYDQIIFTEINTELFKTSVSGCKLVTQPYNLGDNRGSRRITTSSRAAWSTE